MIHWPTSIIIVDDTENCEYVKDALQDLSWIFDLKNWMEKHIGQYSQDDAIIEEIKSLPREIKELADSSPNFFKENFDTIQIKKENDIKTAERALRAEDLAIAFIDFDYSKSQVKDKIYDKYKKLSKDSIWKIAVQDAQQGGCYFSSVFSPSVNNMKVLCPTTYAPPSCGNHFPENIQDAITEHRPLWPGHLAGISAVITALTKWINIQNPCPLIKIWESTKNWFVSSGPDRLPSKDYIPHTLSSELTAEFISDYMEAISDIFGLEFPQEWKSVEAIRIIHDKCLKYLCGADYCGQKDGKRNLTMGSVYLIALLAMRDSEDYHSLFYTGGRVVDLEQLNRLDSMFLDWQSKPDARESAKSLYFLLNNLFYRNPKHASNETLPKLINFGFSDNGRNIWFQFNWNATDGLSSKVAKEKLNSSTKTPKKYSSVLGSLNSLWTTVIRQKQGFGAPGAIWMNDSVLNIASANPDTNA